jgi:hypothetical protein
MAKPDWASVHYIYFSTNSANQEICCLGLNRNLVMVLP